MIEETENQEQSLEDLIEIVERDDLPTNIYTNETTDPMVLLGKINEVLGYLRTLQATISSSDNRASQALENAITALESANTALGSSTTALSRANTALNTANSAISSANNAVETANSASTTATNASNTANSAKQTAEGIAGTANQALNTANSANNTASNASTTASNANNTAQQALTTAQGKQAQLTQTQLDAVNSGITSALVGQIGTNTTNIAGKQAQLTQAQLDAVNSGINTTKVAEIGNKVDKTTTANKLYGTDSNGEQTTLAYGMDATQFAIVQRGGGGAIYVNTTPNLPNDATSKSYVDGLIAPSGWTNATFNSTYIRGGNCRYCVVGKIVIVQMWDIRFTQTAVDNFAGSNNLIAFSGLPSGYAGLVNVCTGSQNIMTLNVSNGNMTNWYSAPLNTNTYYNANFVYIKEG